MLQWRVNLAEELLTSKVMITSGFWESMDVKGRRLERLVLMTAFSYSELPYQDAKITTPLD